MKLKTLTVADIRKINPCYDPTKYLAEDWSGTVLDILSVEDCPPEDRLFVVRKSLQLSDKVLRLFAVACAREAMKITGWDDPRSVAACNVAELFAQGLASYDELATASAAAYAAASADAAAAYTAVATTAAAVDATEYASAAAYATYAAKATYAADVAAAYAAKAIGQKVQQLWQIETMKDLILKEVN